MARHVLVWDAPNIDMTLANIIDGKPTARERPDLERLGHWLVQQADGEDVEACVFVNVADHVAGNLRGWVLWLLEQGFRVFARPKIDDSDVDDDMVGHLQAVHASGELGAAYVGSNDARCFVEPLHTLDAEGVDVTVLGFAEYAGGLSSDSSFRFVDLEDIDDLIPVNLPRINLESLPAEGRWFEPTGRLGQR